MTQWQPIETAPRDGEWLLVFDPIEGVTLAIFAPSEGIFRSPYVEVDFELKPTHWMPLPSPPR